MRARVALFLMGSLVLDGTARAATKKTEREDDRDPDRPAQAKPIPPGEYLRLRDDFIGKLRGVPDLQKLAYSPRQRAVEELGRQVLRRRPLLALGAWNPIGPAPIPNGQTQTTTVAVSGRVTCIAIKPTDPNVVYVGTAQGGVYRTLNGGTSWTAIFDSAASLAIGSIAIAPSQPTTIYVGTGEPNSSLDSFFGVGVYRIDSAETTATLSGPFNQDGTATNVLGRQCISKILVHPTNPDMIWVGTTYGSGGISGASAPGTLPSRGLYRSSNATTTCTFTKFTVSPANGGNRRITDMVMEPGNPDNIVVWVGGTSGTNDGGVWRTTNATTTCTFTNTLGIGATAPGGNIPTGRLAINKVSTVVTVALEYGEATTCGASATDGRVRISVDGGQTWSATLGNADGISGGQGFYDVPIAMDPTDATKIIIGGNAAGSSGAGLCSAILKRTTNGGNPNPTFSDVGSGLHADSHAIEFAPSNASIVYTGNDGGIFKSADGGQTWTTLNNSGFNATQFQSIALHPTDANFSIGGTQDNGTNMYAPAATWNRVDFGDGGYSNIDQNAADNTNVVMYHTYFNQSNNLIGFARVDTVTNASDGNWTFFGCSGNVSANNITCADAVNFYAPMALGPGSPNVHYFGSDRVYRSTDKGVSHTLASQAPIAAGVPVSAIGISPQNDNVRLVGLSNGTVWATTTGSSTLTQMTGSWPAKYIARAVIDPNNANTAYITISGFGDTAGQHVWKTTNLNAGTPTWTAAGGSGGTAIPDVPVDAFLVDPNNSSNLYAGTDIGVYFSADGGTSWNPLGSGFPVVAVFDMGFHNSGTPSSRILRVATHGRGMWEFTGAPVPVTLSAFDVD